MISRSFQVAAYKLVNNKITFAQFVKATDPMWTQVANRVFNRWSTPRAVTQDDVKQEMLLACSQFVKKFDPSREVTPGAYLLWNSVDKAKKWVHVQRGANLHGSSDKNPSRFEVGVKEEKSTRVEKPQTLSVSEQIERSLMANSLLTSIDNRIHKAICQRFFETQSLDFVVSEVLKDPHKKSTLRVDTHDKAARVVKQIVLAVASKAA